MSEEGFGQRGIFAGGGFWPEVFFWPEGVLAGGGFWSEGGFVGGGFCPVPHDMIYRKKTLQRSKEKRPYFMYTRKLFFFTMEANHFSHRVAVTIIQEISRSIAGLKKYKVIDIYIYIYIYEWLKIVKMTTVRQLS